MKIIMKIMRKRQSFPIVWLTIIIVSISFGMHQRGYKEGVKLTSRWEVASPAPVDEDSSFKYLAKGEETFYNTAKAFTPVSDKVTTHMYQIMYGRFLMPYYYQNPTMKMLEIGLGCDMNYNPGASVAIWKKLFPKADLWEAEFNAECVANHTGGMLKDINILIGDQGNETVLDSWIEISEGDFDVVIDDGGHQQCQIWHSFQKLWPTVKPGGLYFIEDLHVGKLKCFRKYTTDTCDEDFLVLDKLKEYLDTLINEEEIRKFQESDIEYIFCQYEACVVGKKR
jgi:hypothetical protein